jgi:hypothetical protein
MRQLHHCTPTASGRPLAYCGPTGVCDVTMPTLDHGFRIRGASPTRTICRRWTGVIGLSCLSVFLALVWPMGRDAAFPCDVVPGFLYFLLIPMIRLIVRRELAALAVAEPAF